MLTILQIFRLFNNETFTLLLISMISDDHVMDNV